MENIDLVLPCKKVMVIDDNEVDLFIAEQRLKKSHFAEEVLIENSARKALSYFKDCESRMELLPQFIFLDIKMLDIDGFGFLEEYESFSDVIKKAVLL